LTSHPHYKHLHDSDAFHHDPFTGQPVVTRLWSAGVMENGKGGWSDLTSKAGRDWWGKGVKSLIDLGVDGMWK
jgi:alpha-glucosidase (family GH31 glycosyl hydrolase)